MDAERIPTKHSASSLFVFNAVNASLASTQYSVEVGMQGAVGDAQQ